MKDLYLMEDLVRYLWMILMEYLLDEFYMDDLWNI